jgi:hypothetical protein
MCLHKDQEKQQKIQATIKLLANQLQAVDWYTVTDDALAYSFNFENLENVKCYCTSQIMRTYQDSAIMYGYHGNQVLLHKDIFVDEILLQNPHLTQNMMALKNSSQRFYSQPLRDYPMDRERIPLEYRYLNIKPWDLLSGMNNNRLYAPLADDGILLQVRQLDFSQVDLDVIADATVARELIHRNVGSMLDEFIATEGVKDNDNLEEAMIPVSKLDPTKLTVPDNLNHNSEGLDYIQSEISQAQSKGYMPINSLVVIKALQWLAKVLPASPSRKETCTI